MLCREKGALRGAFSGRLEGQTGVNHDKEAVNGPREDGAELGTVGSNKEGLGSGLGAQAFENDGWDCPSQGVPRCPQPEQNPGLAGPWGNPVVAFLLFFAFLVL